MKKLFLIVGIGTLLLAVIAFLLLIASPAAAIAAAVGLALSGALMIAVGDLLGRVEALEERLDLVTPPENDPDLPQKTCPSCGHSYDFDYPKCPHCGETHTNSAKS